MHGTYLSKEYYLLPNSYSWVQKAVQSQRSGDVWYGTSRKRAKNQSVGSPTAATSAEDLIGAPTVCHGQAKVVVDRLERSDTSLLISLVLLIMKSFLIIHT